MSQNPQTCACDPCSLVMLPVRGFGLAVDPSGLIPAPQLGGRERVDQDMHIYVNGNRDQSGDGLTPETAVKSYEDALLALSRYDGRNTHNASFHFADLEDAEAVYPDMNVFGQSHATFRTLTLTGVSHQSTRLGKISAGPGSYLRVASLSSSFLFSTGWMSVCDKVAVKPLPPQKAAMQAAWGGNLRFADGAEIFLYPGEYVAAAHAICGGISSAGALSFHALGDLKMHQGFLVALGNGCVRFATSVDFSDCAAVSGRKYYVIEQACVACPGLTLPGSLPGVTVNNGLYV